VGRLVRTALMPVVALLLAAATAVPLATPAEAAPGRCAAGTGVTVVVDFGALGRGVQLGCDPSGGGKQASQVLPQAGFSVTYLTNGQPFVCRIDGLPTPGDEACNATPPEDAYWALYWSNGRDGRWIFAGSGVVTLKVPAGGSIGWRWRDSTARVAPGAPPTTGAAPKPEPTKPTKPPKPTKPAEPPKSTPEPTVAPVTPSQSAAPSASASPAAPPSGRPAAEKQAANRAEKRSEQRSDEGARAGKDDRKADAKADRRAAREAGSSAPADEQVTADAVAQEETPLAPASATDDGGGALTWVAGGAVLLLAAAAGVLARRRRG
jgi:hypothetical protein